MTKIKLNFFFFFLLMLSFFFNFKVGTILFSFIESFNNTILN